MPRREKKKFHFLYKTTNLINGKFYIGIHSTSNLEDGYLGSGKILRYSINKYGVENFKIERLEFFEDKEKLFNREKEIVNESFLKDPSCMNLQPGGGGGFINTDHHKKCTQAGLKSQWNNPKYLEWHKKRQSQRFNELNSSRGNGWGFKNKKHSEKTKTSMSNNHKGHNYQRKEKNSQFGTHWITNGKENKKIHNGDLIPEGWKFGRKYKREYGEMVNAPVQ